MVNLKITSADPFRVLESTRSVLEDARFVFIKEENIPILAGQIRNRFPQGVSLEQIGFR